MRTTSKQGLRWTLKLGSLWGTITTYLIPGATPLLLSRQVPEGMGVAFDLGKMSLTSDKHQIYDRRLLQASNGHLLMPRSMKRTAIVRSISRI